jgi:hypothetical protein
MIQQQTRHGVLSLNECWTKSIDKLTVEEAKGEPTSIVTAS